MHGTILIYGNDAMWLATSSLILEKAGYEVLSARTFGNARLMLMHHQIDVCVLCQSLTEEEQRGIFETARALQPATKCVVLDFGDSEAPAGGVDLIRGLAGPTALLDAIGKLLIQQMSKI